MLLGAATRLVAGTVANGSSIGSIWVAPVDGGPVRELTGFRELVYAIDTDPSPKFVAAAGGMFSPEEAVVRIWDLTSSGEPRVLDPGHGRLVFDLAFSEGWLWEAGAAGLARWNLETAERE